MTVALREHGRVDAGRPQARRLAMLALVAITVVLLVGLGTWQVCRHFWKADLIARVEARVNATPVAMPPPSAWAAITADADEYRHVAVAGAYLAGSDSYVKAVTDLGPGWWLLSPFRTASGEAVLVNRGFVPDRSPRPVDPATTVTGLLRLSEPGGGFLRGNQPAAGLWYSRDVAAIAAADGLADVAPFFIDADGTGDSGFPRGGLTQVSFPDNHIVYALTWYGLAGLLVFGAARALSRRTSARSH